MACNGVGSCGLPNKNHDAEMVGAVIKQSSLSRLDRRWAADINRNAQPTSSEAARKVRE
jgi:hypothetical protein